MMPQWTRACQACCAPPQPHLPKGRATPAAAALAARPAARGAAALGRTWGGALGWTIGG